MRKLGLFVALPFFLLSGCVTKTVVVKSGYDFSKIRRISVMPFNGQGGAMATDEFIRALVGTGIEVDDARHPADVILRGTVTDYKSNNQLTVFLGNTSIMAAGGQTVVVDNPVVSLSGSQVTPQGATMGTHNPQIISIVASVAINAQLVDTSAKTVLWSGSGAYESLELQDALKSVVNVMTRSLGEVIPTLKKNPA